MRRRVRGLRMATLRIAAEMKSMVTLTLALIGGTCLVGGSAFAGGAEVFDVTGELGKAGQGRSAVSLSLVRAPEYTVNAVAIKREIETHRHEDGSHVLYIVSGRGTAILDGKPVALRPGIVVHIPKGVSHSIKVDGEKMTFVDFVQHSVDPTQAERSK